MKSRILNPAVVILGIFIAPALAVAELKLADQVRQLKAQISNLSCGVNSLYPCYGLSGQSCIDEVDAAFDSCLQSGVAQPKGRTELYKNETALIVRSLMLACVDSSVVQKFASKLDVKSPHCSEVIAQMNKERGARQQAAPAALPK